MEILRIEQTDKEREVAALELERATASLGRNGHGSAALRADLPTDTGELHLLVSELEDHRDQGRKREAMWISIVVHLVVFLLLLLSPKLFPNWTHSMRVVNVVPQNEPTFLELPPDLQKYMARPKTNIMSDKNRIAESKNPSPNQLTLQELERMRKQGAPGRGGQPAPQAAQPQPQPQQMAQQQPPQQQQQAQENPKLAEPQAPPQQKPSFNPFGSKSAASSIEQAVQAAANGRGRGSDGDFGEGIRPHPGVNGNAEILSDTQGIDFGPYMQRVIEAVRRNWYSLIPEEAYPPLSKTGKLAIEFTIRKNGSIGELTLAATSGDHALDAAARGGITASNPFPPLPSAYTNPDLKLRFYFYYLGPHGEMK